MRRHFPVFIALVAVLAGTAVRADDGTSDGSPTLLGSGGEVYTVRQGLYGDLFIAAPAGAEAYPVLALDIVRDGTLRRALVPGTGGPETEETPLIAIDPVGNRPYVLWQQDRLFQLAGYGTAGWQNTVELAGDPASNKRNPQLATSVARYETLDGEGKLVAASRTFLHLVWYDDGAAGGRLLYTAAAIEGDMVVPGSDSFDLRVLAGDAPSLPTAATPPAVLRQRPLVQRGRDTDSVGVAFVDSERGELVTLELRQIGFDLLCFADKARVVIIETGHANPGLSHRQLADKARVVIIETGHRIMHPVVADFLGKSFLAALADADPSLSLDQATRAAWAKLIDDGTTLQQGKATNRRQPIELAPAAADGSSRTLDLLWVTRRTLPTFPDADLRLFLSPGAQEASVAWNTPSAVRYRETNLVGWEPVRSLWLGPSLPRDQAYDLVEQRLADQ